jgi:NitT/TauT family transport system permease protein
MKPIEFLSPLLALAALLGLWGLARPVFDIDPILLPNPGEVGRAALDHRGELFSAWLRSGAVATAGFGLSLVLGLILGSLLGLSRWLERIFQPWTVFLQSVPVVAVAPILILWLGPGLPSMIAVSCIVSLFPIINGTAAGLQRTPKDRLDLLRVCGASPLQTWWKLRLPQSTPLIVAGARVSAGLSVVGAIVGEYFTGTGGRGGGLAQAISNCQQSANYPLLFAVTACAALLGFTVYSATQICGERLLRRLGF